VTRVLLVDDSALARRLLKRVLAKVPGVEVIGEASDPYVARELIVELQPEVVVLDVEMPRMDGISFLERLMRYCPLPVVVCSSVTVAGGEVALRALAAGAVAVVRKPNENYPPEEMGRDLIQAVTAAAAVTSLPSAALAAASLRPAPGQAQAMTVRPMAGAPRVTQRPDPLEQRDARVVALGASTGGTVAVENIIAALPPDFPALLVVQHLPPYIVPAFAARLDQRSRVSVTVASEGAVLRPGCVLIAPGDAHLLVERSGVNLKCRLWAADKINGHRPAVDALFFSLAETAPQDAVGVLLTGMGRDGAQGLLALRSAGARTLAQDEASSVVWGMPKAAIDLGAAQEVLPLNHMARRLTQLTQRRTARTARPPALGS
jgi:two-component system, chemotaxis family, protein-glutamate methylesterase/glutaminase